MLNISPIKLLKGTHEDTGSTGHGCFMNVIAYLNGDPQITDKSPCVCVTVKPIAIWLNDYMKDNERSQLLPYIERALGSATSDIDLLTKRAWMCAHYAQRRAASAASVASAVSAERAVSAAMDVSAAKSARAASVASAERAAIAAMAKSAAMAASVASAAMAAMAASVASAASAERAAIVASAASAASAERAASAAPFDYTAFQAELIADTLKLLDNLLPPATPLQQVHIERAQKLVELCS
jgi:hypothetical protein